MKIEFTLDHDYVDGVCVFEGIQKVLPKWTSSIVVIGEQTFALGLEAAEMMYAANKFQGTGERLSVEIPDELVQDCIEAVRIELMNAIIQNALIEEEKLTPWEDESSSFTDGEQAQAPTGSLG